MNEFAIEHIPESKYCFAEDKNTVTLRLRVSKYDMPEKVEVVYGGKYDYATVQLRAIMKRYCEDKLFAYYTATLHLADVRLVYIFAITENGKEYYFSEDGLTEHYDYTLNYYNCFQLAYVNDIDVMKPIEWLKTATFYQIFVERFNIGLKDKDKSYINLKWGELPKPKSFAGGDIKGITEKLNYINDLGINALYLTPVFSSISNHKYDISDYYNLEKNFGIKALITVFAIAVFAVPSTCTMLKKAGNYEKNIKNSIVVTDFLQSKGLVYGYGTYWNSDRFTAFSDFKVKVNKVRVDKTVYAHYFMCSSYDYSEEAYQGPTFLILTEDEKDIFLDSESYLKLGEPTEVCDISNFTIFVYDYNIANNNFEGGTGGFTGIETEKINAACRQYNVDIVLRYDSGYITQIIGGDTNNITEIDGDYNILVLTHDRLAEPAKMLDTPIGEYNLYMCKMSELGYTPNPNYVSGSDFEDDGDLSEWSVGGGETAVCNDGSLTITCTRESDRRFEQTITISEEQIGKPMTISFEISSIDGYVLTRIWGADFNANRYITETISEPGKYSFTFTPTSDEITIQPILPEKLNNGAVVEWVKLESGSVATDYVA